MNRLKGNGNKIKSRKRFPYFNFLSKQQFTALILQISVKNISFLYQYSLIHSISVSSRAEVILTTTVSVSSITRRMRRLPIVVDAAR